MACWVIFPERFVFLMRFMLALFVACVLLVPRAAEAQCLEYGTPNTELVGELKRRVVPGPPNKESVARGDQSDTVWVLRLDRSICLKAGADGPARRRISEVLLVSDDPHVLLRGVLDKRVVFRGQLAPTVAGDRRIPVTFFAKVYVVELKRPGS